MRGQALFILALILSMAGASAKTFPSFTLMQPDSETAGQPCIESIRPITQGPKHHFFGYYGISPWDATEKYLICLETEFGDRLPEPSDQASLILIDLSSGAAKTIAETHAWNFQQGAMLHWIGLDPAHTIIYNDRAGESLQSVILNVFTGEKRTLPRPIAAMSPDGKCAASLNFPRMWGIRPGYSYPGLADPFAGEQAPRDDGLFIMDTATGESKLIVSLADILAAQPLPKDYNGNPLYINHVMFSRNGKRLLFLARYKAGTGGSITAAFTINPDGTGLYCLIPYEWNASHFDWLDATRLMVSTRYQAGPKWYHVLFTDGQKECVPLAPDFLQQDGHGHFSADGKWMVTDSYPRGEHRMRSLYLMDMASQAFREVGRFHEPPQYKTDCRCDLHPRWNRDATQLCIDSTHEGTRQVYLLRVKK